jgi:hypothetical protein
MSEKEEVYESRSKVLNTINEELVPKDFTE